MTKEGLLILLSNSHEKSKKYIFIPGWYKVYENSFDFWEYTRVGIDGFLGSIDLSKGNFVNYLDDLHSAHKKISYEEFVKDYLQ